MSSSVIPATTPVSWTAVPDGSAASPSFAFQNSSGTGFYRVSANVLGISTAGVQRVVIDASGNVGVGTASPGYKLHSTGAIGSGTTGTNGFYGLRRSSDGVEIGSLNTDGTNVVLNTGGATAFQTAGTERARIDSSGNFTVKGGNFNIANTSGTTQFTLNPNAGTGGWTAGSVLSSGAGTNALKWSSVSGIISYDTSSSLVKTNIIDSPYGLSDVLKLTARKYFRTDDQKEEIGFIAEEVKDVIPEVVPLLPKHLFTKNEDDTELIPGSVNYDRLTAVLVKAIQELSAKVDAQAAEIEALKNK